MSVLGPQDTEKFLQKLDERKLLDICTDILALEGHTNIKIMEGPGDGQRDIHSIGPDGSNYLIQSKFHSDFSQSVSAKELGEVVLGMVRFGYKHGLFITSAKISPQAKRDCLNDYPDYFVDFLEGWEIAKKVFDNLVLKAIWYDGHSIDKVAYTLVVPILVRNLETDKPLPLLPEHTQTLKGNEINIGRSEVQVNYQRGSSSSRVFGEYRSPKRKTPYELGSPNLGVTEAILSGVIHLEDIEQIIEALGDEVLAQVPVINPQIEHYAVVLGRPSLTPLGGEASGARIELEDYSPRTLVSHNGFKGMEVDWILPSEESKWVLPDSPRISQADWIRWYNCDYDICLDIIIQCPPSDEVKWQFVEQHDHFIKWWNESLFMLMPAEILERLEDDNIPQPTESYEWNTKQALCIWLHPIFNSPFIYSSIEPEYEDIDPHPSKDDLIKAKDYLESIRSKVELLGGVAVDPEKARHMVAIQDEDPYPNFENVIFQGKHLAYDVYIVPSPIDPRSRRFQFSVCWEIAENNSQQLSLDQLMRELQSRDYHPFQSDLFLDTDTLSKATFIINELIFSPDDIFRSTPEVLENATLLALKTINETEKYLSQQTHSVRATRKYWDKELWMKFRCS